MELLRTESIMAFRDLQPYKIGTILALNRDGDEWMGFVFKQCAFKI